MSATVNEIKAVSGCNYHWSYGLVSWCQPFG